jgi:pimeloyl-ACP methyl ester carboxylesterase
MFPITLALASALTVSPAPNAAVPTASAAVLPVSALAVPDTLVDVGGHRLHLEVLRGTEPLTLVLEAGGGADLSSWATVPESLAARTGATVVAYDRAGRGQSDLGPTDLAPRDEIAHLRVALEHLDAPRPAIVVATSYGAMLALLHAALHPDDVVGLVLVDPMNPRFVRATGDFLYSTVPDLSDPRTNTERALARMVSQFEELVDEIEELEPGLRTPMVILTAGEKWWGIEEIDAAWRASHEATAGAAPRRRQHIVEGTDHDISAERPDAVVDAVLELVRDSGLPLPTGGQEHDRNREGHASEE